MHGGRPFRATVAGDMFVANTGSERPTLTLLGAKLAAGAAAAAATLTDQDGTVLAELVAPANGGDWLDIPVAFVGKVRLNAISGAGAVVMVYVL